MTKIIITSIVLLLLLTNCNGNKHQSNLPIINSTDIDTPKTTQDFSFTNTNESSIIPPPNNTVTVLVPDTSNYTFGLLSLIGIALLLKVKNVKLFM